ncbi:MAG: PadR family transcriptional regulator, partial [Candidatus Binataceae bacterium]
ALKRRAGRAAAPLAPRESRDGAAPNRRIKASLEHALLGLIAERGRVSGYDLIKVFRLSMVHYWHAHQSQIYPTLDRMVRRGLIRSRDVIQRGRPNKRVFSITVAGERMLMQWLASPFEAMKVKHSSLLRCRFLGHLGADGARAKLLEQSAALQRYLDTFEGFDREFFPRDRRYPDVNSMFTYFTLRDGIDEMRRALQFCEWAIAEIERNRQLFAMRKPPSAGRAPALIAALADSR